MGAAFLLLALRAPIVELDRMLLPTDYDQTLTASAITGGCWNICSSTLRALIFILVSLPLLNYPITPSLHRFSIATSCPSRPIIIAVLPSCHQQQNISDPSIPIGHLRPRYLYFNPGAFFVHVVHSQTSTSISTSLPPTPWRATVTGFLEPS